MDAFRAEDECPFCYIEKMLEEHALDFVLGAEVSYMQKEVRAKTDQMGFCREHWKKMYAYGNSLGNALILDTHLQRLRGELKESMNKDCSKKWFRKVQDSVSQLLRKEQETCYICEEMKRNYERYLATFFELFRKQEKEFMELLKSGKGFCLIHFADVLDAAPKFLGAKEEQELRGILYPQMLCNLDRIQEELDWFEKKFDYRYREADWKQSKDVIPRAMQKIAGGYPAAENYRQK